MRREDWVDAWNESEAHDRRLIALCMVWLLAIPLLASQVVEESQPIRRSYAGQVLMELDAMADEIALEGRELP